MMPTWISSVLFVAILVATANAVTSSDEKPRSNKQGEPDRLNVVLILADDLGFGELGCYGQSKIRTPNIDRLAAQGMRFSRYYSAAPTCAPSRCALLTGRHTGHAQIRANKAAPHGDGPEDEGEFPIRDDAVTLAEIFQRAGYSTGAFGKWGLGPVGSSGAPHRQGFDLFFGYNSQSAAHSYYPPFLWRNDTRVDVNERPIAGHAKQPEGQVRAEDWIGEKYAPDLMVAEAREFIRAHRNRPFFLYLPFIEPHLALQPPLRLVESYPGEWDDSPYRGENGYVPHPRPRAAYAALITSLDEHVGEIMTALDECGLTENTIVVFTSDNGTTHSVTNDSAFDVGGVDADFFDSVGGLRGRKGSLYEGGIRVPLIVRWPGRVPAGSESDFVCYAPDLFGTLCDAARIDPPVVDGVNLVPVLTGEDLPTGRRPLIWAFAEYGGQIAVRMGDIKVIRQKLLTDQPGAWEVYDLAKDPNETNDLAADRPEAIREAMAILRDEIVENEVFPLTGFERN